MFYETWKVTSVVVPTRYAGKKASLATMHGKHELISPHMNTLGLTVFTSPIDTDMFGTFTGDIARRESPIDTAIAKAREGMRASSTTLGIASEGSIGVQGFLPIVADVETVVFVDDEEGFVLAETAISHQIVAHSWLLSHGLPQETDLERAGFPDHGLIVRTDADDVATTKGIHDLEHLNRVVEQCWEKGATQITVESDLRAHHCPSRRPTIAEAARKLAERLSTSCPSCHCPGWGLVDVVRGRECALCNGPTQGKIADVYGCCRCPEQITTLIDVPLADPSTCERCNP